MGGVVSSITDAVGGVFDAAGDIVGGVADVAGDFVDAAGKVVSDIDIKDAVTTYVLTGGNPYAAAFAATSGDEKLGFNPAAFYDPTSGSFGFADPNVYGGAGAGGMPDIFDYPGKSIIEPVATKALQSFAQGFVNQDEGTKQQLSNIANLTLEGLGKLQEEIASGKYEQRPSLNFFERLQTPNSDITSRYADIKQNIRGILYPTNGVSTQRSAGIYADFLTKKGLL